MENNPPEQPTEALRRYLEQEQQEFELELNRLTRRACFYAIFYCGNPGLVEQTKDLLEESYRHLSKRKDANPVIIDAIALRTRNLERLLCGQPFEMAA